MIRFLLLLSILLQLNCAFATPLISSENIFGNYAVNKTSRPSQARELENLKLNNKTVHTRKVNWGDSRPGGVNSPLSEDIVMQFSAGLHAERGRIISVDLAGTRDLNIYNNCGFEIIDFYQEPSCIIWAGVPAVEPSVRGLFENQITVKYETWTGLNPAREFTFIYTIYSSTLDKIPEDPNLECGSIIDVDSRSVSESVPIVGADFSLVYSSLYDIGSDTSLGISATSKYNKEGWNPSIYHHYSWQQKRLYSGAGQISPREYTGNSDVEVFVNSADGADYYKFSPEGLHLETRTTLTGALQYSFVHDANQRLIQIVDAYGGTTNINRDSSGKISNIVGPFGLTTTISHGTNGKISSISNPQNETYSMTYDSGGRLHLFTKPGGQVTTFTYDSNGKLLKDLGNGGNFWQLIESTAGQISKVSQMGRTSTFTRTFSGYNPIRTSTLPSGESQIYEELTDTISRNVSSYVDTKTFSDFDWRFKKNLKMPNRRETKIGGVTSVTTYALSTDGTPLSPFGYTYYNKSETTSGRTYTSNFNKTAMTLTESSPSGATKKTVLNSHEQPVSIQVGSDTATSFTYDLHGRISESVAGTTHNKKTYTYNTSGFLQSIRNAFNEVTSFTHDLAGRVTSVILPDLRTIQYTYDPNGNLVSVKPPGRPVHTFNLNAMELTGEYQPPALSGVFNVNTQYSYNLDKQLTQITTPSGETVVNNYHATTGLLSNIVVSGGTHYYTYHPNTDLVSRIDSRDGIRSNYTYYGPMLASEEQRWGGNNFLFGKVTYQYDSDHRLSARNVQGNLSSNSVNVTIDYNSDSVPIRVGDIHYGYTYPSGRLATTTIDNISDSRVYDTYGNLSEYRAYYNPPGETAQLLYSYILTRDALNRVNMKTEFIQGTTTTYSYGYDSVGRLSTVHRNGLPYSCYFYDSNGNRISGVINGIPFTATYDAQDRVLTYAGKTYTHTADGYVDLVTYPDATTQQYVFDTLGNFRTVKLRNGQTEFYQHDGQYRLVSLFLGNTLQYRNLYAEKDRIVAKVNNSGYLSEGYIFGSRQQVPEYVLKNSQKHRVITDHLGSVRVVVNTIDGSTSQQMDYNEWGYVISDSSPGFQPYGFAGGIYLNSSKVVKFGSRIYDTLTGRWLSKDPILFDGGDTSLYGYVENDPINWIDPAGEAAVASTRQVDGALGGGGAVGAIPISAIIELFTNPLQSEKCKKKDEEKPKGGHKNNARPSTKEKHEKGDSRRQKDRGGEKGDARRPYSR